MININDKEYKGYNINVSERSFSVSSYKDGKKSERNGIAPYIQIALNNEIDIGIEMNFSYDMFKELELDKDIDITKYITDILYSDELGWVSIIDSEHYSRIKKISDDEYSLSLYVKDGSFDIEVNLEILLKL